MSTTTTICIATTLLLLVNGCHLCVMFVGVYVWVDVSSTRRASARHHHVCAWTFYEILAREHKVLCMPKVIRLVIFSLTHIWRASKQPYIVLSWLKIPSLYLRGGKGGLQHADSFVSFVFYFLFLYFKHFFLYHFFSSILNSCGVEWPEHSCISNEYT